MNESIFERVNAISADCDAIRFCIESALSSDDTPAALEFEPEIHQLKSELHHIKWELQEAGHVIG